MGGGGGGGGNQTEGGAGESGVIGFTCKEPFHTSVMEAWIRPSLRPAGQLTDGRV